MTNPLKSEGVFRSILPLMQLTEQVEALARRADLEQEIFFVPALVGLGAPHWVPEARGAIFGLTRAATSAEAVTPVPQAKVSPSTPRSNVRTRIRFGPSTCTKLTLVPLGAKSE